MHEGWHGHDNLFHAQHLFAGDGYICEANRFCVDQNENGYCDTGEYFVFPDLQNCDGYRIHPKAEFEAGELWQAEAAALPHDSLQPGLPGGLSAYQVHHEFLCDAVDVPQPWLPASVLEQAAISANRIATDYIIPEQSVPFTCGAPTPFGGVRSVTRNTTFLCGGAACPDPPLQLQGFPPVTGCPAHSVCDAGCCEEEPPVVK